MSRMLELEQLAWHKRGILTVTESGFAHDRRDIVEYVHTYLLKGLLPDSELKAMYDEFKAKYGPLSPTPEATDKRPKPSEPPSDDGEGGALVPNPKPKPVKPSPGAALTHPMFACAR